jgi:hypothetical protein
MRKPTIYEALVEKLGRRPTETEVKADVERILGRRRDPDECPDCGLSRDGGDCGCGRY